jgi:hypothetical protein
MCPHYCGMRSLSTICLPNHAVVDNNTEYHNPRELYPSASS